MFSFDFPYRDIFTRRMLICMCTGFASGLPLYLLIQLVPAWLRLEGVSLATIGFIGLVLYPYSINFVWSPLLERYALPMLGHRRGWMLVIQIGLVLSIASLGLFDPSEQLAMIVAVAICIAFFSASQDIVLDAFRHEILESEGDLALGNTIHVQAYKISGLIPGSLGMSLIGVVSWQINCLIMAAAMSISILITLMLREPVPESVRPTRLYDAITRPFVEFFQRRQSVYQSIAVIAFMVTYKLGDNMATALATPFYIDLGFSTQQIGFIAKNAALWPSIFGGVVGALIVLKSGINKALWWFGGVQLISIFGYVWLSQAGADPWVLALVITGEYLGVGLGTTAYVAFIFRETSRLAVATQLAMFTALATLPRTVATSFSGVIVEAIGWTDFFYLSALLALPGMVLLTWVAPYRQSPDQAGRLAK